MRIGLDIGSTTMKCIILDARGNIVFQKYERHYSQIALKAAEMIETSMGFVPDGTHAFVTVSGSAGMGLARTCGLEFVQEVHATRLAARKYLPDIDVIIELGGEDAKILFLTNGVEVRMNGTCAGGTGAFIDQMATLLGITQTEMNTLASAAQKTYTVASRCGVFAKSDIQPLINQGAAKEDISASIFVAVVNQTIAGLAQGRPIEGNVAYLGGPLTFFDQLRLRFDDALKLTGTCPENSLYYVALGAALYQSARRCDLALLLEQLRNFSSTDTFLSIPPLFTDENELKEFSGRHAAASLPHLDAASYHGPAWLGIDAGSTTVKCCIVTPEGAILHSRYQTNNGNPIPAVREFLTDFMEAYPHIGLQTSAVTGYGEEMIRKAFGVDYGIVETIAHFTAAKKFLPEVDFIIDIGGQDIKCFKIRNGAIDNLFLNEACSSGCGSFLQTFAQAWGMSIEDFARKGLLAGRPVDLGSRCTVFMNSSVKQAQKDGATIEDISAGLSISVVKNALYKVIRVTNAEDLGKHIVVQGGTFLNDAVLRAFEMELGTQVIRPTIAGLMGAYGAALYAGSRHQDAVQTVGPSPTTSLVSLAQLKALSQETRTSHCGLCGNHCLLTITIFDGTRRFITGNRCDRPTSPAIRSVRMEDRDMFAWKLEKLLGYKPVENAPRGEIGLPFGLNMYDLLPFWHTFFTELGFTVRTSHPSDRKLYLSGQATIPSDTVCFPAKLMHGHVTALLDAGVTRIFYPCMSYNVDEGKGNNHFNCPVVAYYPEVLKANMPRLKDPAVDFISDYLGLENKRAFRRRMKVILSPLFPDMSGRDIARAAQAAYTALDDYRSAVIAKGDEIIANARKAGRPIVVLAGRPYHVDPEVNHGLDKLIVAGGADVVTEDAVSVRVEKQKRTILNQWTYHARMYDAARYVCTQPDMTLVQLVSFGCGLDAVTTDEVRDILETGGKIPTELKIDEITNLGAIRIRLRSLFAALGW